MERLDAPFELEKLWTSWTQLRGMTIAGLLETSYKNPTSRALLKPEAIFEIEMGLALSANDIIKASALRAQWFARCVELFSTFDVLVLPSSQVFPFEKTTHWPAQVNKQRY